MGRATSKGSASRRNRRRNYGDISPDNLMFEMRPTFVRAANGSFKPFQIAPGVCENSVSLPLEQGGQQFCVPSRAAGREHAYLITYTDMTPEEKRKANANNAEREQDATYRIKRIQLTAPIRHPG